jgi:hypothetical protein
MGNGRNVSTFLDNWIRPELYTRSERWLVNMSL